MRIFLLGLLTLTLNIHGGEVKDQGSYLTYEKDIQFSFCFSPEEGSQNPQAITVTYTNISKQKGILRLPIPLYGNREIPDNTKYPLLLLILNNSKGQEQGFVFTLGVDNEISDKDRDKDKKEIFLQPGEKYSENYLLSDFWMRGSCNVNKEGCFSKVIRIKPDGQPLQVKVCFMLKTFVEKHYSNEITIKCSCPDWMFPVSKETDKKQ